eukprot:Gb_31720 [translate_table: standard]
MTHKGQHSGYKDIEGFDGNGNAGKSDGEQDCCKRRETTTRANETENLDAQQHQLEETQRAIEAAKSTLGAQLKATKQMLVDASLTAQKASREREALEEERRLLAKSQKEMETSIATREAKLALEAKKLESIRSALEQEKAQAMAIIQESEWQKRTEYIYEPNASKIQNSENSWERTRSEALVSPAKAAYNYELQSKAKSSHASSLIHKIGSDLQRRPPSKAESIKSSEFEHGKGTEEVDCGKLEWEEMQDKDGMNRLQVNNSLSFENQRTEPNEAFQGTQLSHDPHKELKWTTLHCHGSNGSKVVDAVIPPHSPLDAVFAKNNCPHSDTPLDVVEQHKETLENCSSSMVKVLQKSQPPSQKRLENVMISLIKAREASRDRLQRTQNALETFRGTSALAEDVKQSLRVLAIHLISLEQMEDELASQLTAAYAAKPPDSEGMIVDKVQLLCRMEEQQTMRAEWEEEIEKQLVKISSLQTMPNGLPCFSTPIKKTVYDRLYSPQSLKESSRFTSLEYLQDQSDAFNIEAQGIDHSNEIHDFMHAMYLTSSDWNRSQECSQEGKTRGFSPHIDEHNHRDTSDNNPEPNQPGTVLSTKETNARRRLQLSMP